jgi:hypothetical protein
MTAAPAPISATTEQEQHQENNEDQFHGVSPLMVLAVLHRQSDI